MRVSRPPPRPLLLLALAGIGLGAATDEGADLFRTPYRAERWGVVAEGVPREVALLLPERTAAWPALAQEALAQRIRDEWVSVAHKLYGTLHAGLGVSLQYPLVTARSGRRVWVPVVEGPSIPIEGVLALPAPRGPRRVILLVDASSSANARTSFRTADGSFESISVLEAERRALEHLVELLADDWLEFGLIAFGEGTWPIVEPGASVQSVREALSRFRAEHPRGEGRTDLVCALSLARDWLGDTPEGVEREIFLLSDGDLPHSGRFTDCGFARKRRGKQAEASCLARRNQTSCPASRFSWGAGRSDLVQLSAFARRARRDVTVHPLVFEPDRAARAYHELAQRTGGELLYVSSPQAIDAVLPVLIAGRIRGVFARNERTGHETEDLLEPGGARFRGALPLQPGANDVELRVESDRGTAALFRFRIYAVPRYLERYLAQLRERNRSLELEVAEIAAESRKRSQNARRRSLELITESGAGDSP